MKSTVTIDRKMTLEEIAAFVCQSLRDSGVDSFLSGGAVVTIYSENRYQSWDLDFVSFGARNKIHEVMERLGFKREKSRYYIHADTEFFVEFPGTASMVGDEVIHDFSMRSTPYGSLKLLTPTDCVKDRLASFYHWNDPQSLEQAIQVARAQEIKWANVEIWSKKEGFLEKYEEFVTQYKRRSK